MDAKMKRQLDNRGMTLVELMVAMIILAIIVVPLLHAFVSAARVNLDSRTRLRLTTVAQDVMEGLRADTLEELAEEFNYPVPAGGYLGFHVINRNLVKGSISENRCSIASDGKVTGFTTVNDSDPRGADYYPSAIPSGGSVSYNFIPRDGSYGDVTGTRDDGMYYFSMQDVTVENASSPNYKVDVLVSVNAVPYRSDARGGTVTSLSGNMARHNDTDFVDIAAMNEQSDYIFYVNLPKLIEDNCSGMGLTSKDVYSKMWVDLSPDLLGTGTIAKLTVRVYRVSDMHELFFDENQITKNEVRSLFLMYFPTYGHTSVPDTIEFVNKTDYKCNFYIAKQYDSNDMDIRSNLRNYENNYRCNVIIKDEPVSGSSVPMTNVRTNLDYNLYDINDNGGTISKIDPAYKQATYTYTGTGGISITSADYEDKYVSGPGGSSRTDRLYDVHVYVYKEGSISGALSSGTIPAENLLVDIEGSMK